MEDDKNNLELTKWGTVWLAGKISIIIGFIGIATICILSPITATAILPVGSPLLANMARKQKQS